MIRILSKLKLIGYETTSFSPSNFNRKQFLLPNFDAPRGKPRLPTTDFSASPTTDDGAGAHVGPSPVLEMEVERETYNVVDTLKDLLRDQNSREHETQTTVY